MNISPAPLGKAANKSNLTKTGQIIQLIFKISQHQRDKKLLELIANYTQKKNIFFFWGKLWSRLLSQ